MHKILKIGTAVLLQLLVLQLVATQSQSSVPAPGYPKQVAFEAQHKETTTILAVTAVVLLTATYSFLVGRGTRLTSKARLPLREVIRNIEHILESHWISNADRIPERMMSHRQPFCLAHIGRVPPQVSGIELYLMRQVGKSTSWHWKRLDAPKVRGRYDSTHTFSTEFKLNRQGCYLTSGSQLTKSVVQLAIWEWVFCWVAMLMFVSIVFYNGFATGHIRPDGVPRLVVTSLFVSGYTVHAVYVFANVSKLFSLILAGSAWTMLNQAGFAVIRLEYLQEGGAKIKMCSIDRANEEYVSRSFAYEHCVSEDEISRYGWSAGGVDSNQDLDREEATATMKKIAENERKSCQDAAKDALDKIIANGMIMVAICISCGFTVWTDVPSSALTTQIGSWGLLASLSLGMGLMYSSAIQLSVVLEAFKEILTIKEANINDAAVSYVTKQLGRGRNVVGFTQCWQPCRMNWLKAFDFTILVDWLRFIALGPVSAILPQVNDMRVDLSQAKFAFDIFFSEFVVATGNLLPDWECADKIVLGRPRPEEFEI